MRRSTVSILKIVVGFIVGSLLARVKAWWYKRQADVAAAAAAMAQARLDEIKKTDAVQEEMEAVAAEAITSAATATSWKQKLDQMTANAEERKDA